MGTSRIGEWLGVLTNIGVIAGLCLVAYQIAQTNDALELQRKQWNTSYRWDRTEIFTDFWTAIAQDSELSEIWRKGHAGEELSPSESHRYQILSRQNFWLQWNSHRNEMSRLDLLPPQPFDSDGPLRIIIRAKNRYPGVSRELDHWLDETNLDDFRHELERVEREAK